MEIKLADVNPESPIVCESFSLSGQEIKLVDITPAGTERFSSKEKEKQHEMLALAISELDDEFTIANKMLPMVLNSGGTKHDLEVTKKLLVRMQIQITKFSATIKRFQKEFMSDEERLKFREQISSRKKQISEYKQERRFFRKTRENVKKIPSELFAEMWKSKRHRLPIKSLVSAIAIVLLHKYEQKDDFQLSDHYIESFWASAKLKKNIIRLHPEDISKGRIRRLRNFLRLHPEVNYKKIQEVSSSIAALEPWLSISLNIAERVVVENRTKQNALEDKNALEIMLQYDTDDRQTVEDRLKKTHSYQTKITKLLKTVDQRLEKWLPVVDQSFSSLELLGCTSSPIIPKRIITSANGIRSESKEYYEQEQKRLKEEEEIEMLASVISRGSKDRNRSAVFKRSEQEEKRRKRKKKATAPKTIPIIIAHRESRKSFKELGDRSGTHRNNPRYWGRHKTERRQRTQRTLRSIV